jgi:hypothetical protein
MTRCAHNNSHCLMVAQHELPMDAKPGTACCLLLSAEHAMPVAAFLHTLQQPFEHAGMA